MPYHTTMGGSVVYGGLFALCFGLLGLWNSAVSAELSRDIILPFALDRKNYLLERMTQV